MNVSIKRAGMPGLIFMLIAAFAFFYSLFYLDTKPRIWTDEAFTIELSRGLASGGVLDVEVAPGVFTGNSHLFLVSGYPVTVPLAGLYTLFGPEFMVARGYMLLWLLGALAAAFLFFRKVFDPYIAASGIALLGSFAPLYASRAVGGEIPGFLFLLSAVYFWIVRSNYWFTGLFLGLALVTKPSVYLMLVPAFVVALFFDDKERLSRGIQSVLGFIAPVLVWAAFAISNPLDVSEWKELFSFTQNPYGSDVAVNMLSNISSFFSSTTLIYFAVLFAVLLAARIFIVRGKIALLYNFTLIFAALAFFYYLRSPGWLRYLFGAEFLILLLTPHAFFSLLCDVGRKYRRLAAMPQAKILAALVSIMVLMQFAHLFTNADIFYSDAALNAADYIDKTYSQERIAVMNNFELYSLIKSPHRSTIQELMGLPVFGTNPLDGSTLPDVVVSYEGNKFFDPAKASQYQLKDTVSGYQLYEHKR